MNKILIRNNWKRLFVILLLCGVCLNFLQAIFTEILTDEAYYFLYGENLSWGYFDHPPFVGLMIYLSKLFFDGNLSVRFMTIFLQVGTICFCWKLVDEKNPYNFKVSLFFQIIGSLVMFQIYGFITTPDVPLLFFTAFFLWSYKKFLEKESWFSVLWLAVSMAGMVYSKYHALMIIGLIVLSNLKMLLRTKFWIAGLLALLLMSPHIYWQIANDFPSLKYHITYRNNGFEWDCFLGYIPNQMVVFNPFILCVVAFIIFKNKARDVFERGLYFLIVGFIGFFWTLSTFRYVEPHWTIACSIPFIVLLYRYSFENPRILQIVRKGAPISVALILLGRVVLVSGLLPKSFAFNGKEEQSKALEIIAKGHPVVFTGSFQRASNYHFFTKQEALLLSAVNTRYTQFDFLQKELQYQGMPVFVCVPIEGKSDKYLFGNTFVEGFFANRFQSVNRLEINYELKAGLLSPGDSIRLDITIHNPTEHSVDFQHAEFPVACRAGFGITSGYKRFDFVDCELNEPLQTLMAHGELKRTLTTVVPDIIPGRYQFFLTLENMLCAPRNSHFTPIRIKQKK